MANPSFLVPSVPIISHSKYPGYGIVWLGGAAVPVRVRHGKVVDCFTPGKGAITAFPDTEQALEFIATDYAATHR